MKRTLVCWLVVAAMVLGSASPSWAAGKAKKRRATTGTRRRRRVYKKRSRTQKGRIRSGVKDGSLTRKEAGKLVRQQKRINRARVRMASDGKLTAKEKTRLQHMQNRASGSIFRQRHDKDGKMGPVPKDPKTGNLGVNQRQRNQHRRIVQGIRKGSLTKEEAKGLISKERELAKLERELKADGVLTKEERQQLHKQLGDLSKLIFGEKHDEEKRAAARSRIRKALEEGKITRAQAKTVYAKMWHVHRIKRALAGNENLTEAKRNELQEGLATLLDELNQLN